MNDDQKIEHLKGFYGVKSREELILIQSLHIGRLQEKLDILKPKPIEILQPVRHG